MIELLLVSALLLFSFAVPVQAHDDMIVKCGIGPTQEAVKLIGEAPNFNTNMVHEWYDLDGDGQADLVTASTVIGTPTVQGDDIKVKHRWFPLFYTMNGKVLIDSYGTGRCTDIMVYEEGKRITPPDFSQERQ